MKWLTCSIFGLVRRDVRSRLTVTVLLLAFAVSASLFGDEVEQVKAAKKRGGGEKVLGEAIGALLKAFTPKFDVELPPVVAAPVPAPIMDAVEAVDDDEPLFELDDSDESAELKKLEAEVKGKPGGKQSLKQYRQRMEGLTREELRFMHELVNLRRSQFDAIKPDVDRTTLRVALEAAKIELVMNQGWNGQPPKPPHVYKMIEDGMIQAAKKCLTDEQAATYCEELEARQLFRKEAEAGLILGYIDAELRLTDTQRKKLMPCLVKAWAPNWEQHLSIIEGNGLQYLPKLPKNEFRKVLTKKQDEIFRSVANVNHNFFMGMNAHQFPAVNRNARPLVEELDFAPEVDEESP